MDRDLLIIFIRNPVLNKVKTRISEKTGSKVALTIYIELLSAVFKNATEAKSAKAIYFSDKVDETIEPGFSFEPHVQKGADLGERMSNAFMESFNNGYDKVILTGSDCYELSPEIISEAFEKLQKFDCVIGPANDGGYYLIGLSKEIPELFSGIIWGSSEVFNQTIHILNNTNFKYHLLPSLSDVDTIEDVLKYSKLRSFLND
jgi:rSAM/selenodomain-associated transferase 1